MSDPSPPHHAARQTAGHAQEIVFRGRVYSRPDDMPAADRQAYEQVRKTLDHTIPTGAPDAWEG